jgi:hypothetical protein
LVFELEQRAQRGQAPGRARSRCGSQRRTQSPTRTGAPTPTRAQRTRRRRTLRRPRSAPARELMANGGDHRLSAGLNAIGTSGAPAASDRSRP